MKVLLVYAHPESRSLNGSLKDFTVAQLEAARHDVQVSDLHAMKWKAVLDADDSSDRGDDAPFNASLASKRAFEHGTQSPDIAAEQEKLRWADALVLQFPLWWFSMPAILKAIHARGLRAVSIPELLALDPPAPGQHCRFAPGGD